MRIFSDLLLKSAVLVLDNAQDFPSSPQIGQFCFTGGILYIYATLDGTTTWWPLTDKINYYVHSHGLSGMVWTINHNLDSTDLIFMVYDHNNEIQLISDVNFVDSNNIELSFTEPTRGKAIIFSASGTGSAGTAGSDQGSRIPGSLLVEGNVYYQDDSELSLAKADADTTMPAIGIADSDTTLLYSGTYTYATSQGWTKGQILYVSPSTAGQLTSTIPVSSGNQVQRVGVALANDTVLIMPSLDVGGIA